MKNIYIIALIFIFMTTSNAANYYVSTSGNNSNNGTIESPWLTIQYGLNQLASGDVLFVLTGIYNEQLVIPISNISLQNNPGDTPILDGTGLSAVAMLNITDVSNITIDGLEIRNNIKNDAQGILVDGHCENITIQNCVIHDIHFSANVSAPATPSKNAQGIIVYGSDANNPITNLKILNNELYNCRLGYSEGIAVNGNVDGFVVSGNLVHDLTNIGIDAIGHEGTSSNSANDQARNGNINNNTIYNCLSTYATSGGLYIDGGKSIIIENNTSYHNGYGIEVGCENFGKTTDDITVRNNVFYDNEVSALALGGFDYPSSTGKVINSTFRNNTCYFNDYLNDFIGELYLSYFENCTIESNIFYTTNQNVVMYHEGTLPINSTINYNLYYSNNLGSGMEFTYNAISYIGLTAFNTATGYEANGVQANPQLVTASISSPDFHLMMASPAINIGNPGLVASSNEVDLDGASRIDGGRVDCGVDEYAGIVPVTYLEGLSGYRAQDYIILQWSISSAYNGAYFVIERSKDGTEWETIGEVATQNDLTGHLYRIKDEYPLKGTTYYRLKQFDIDGTYSYSNIISIYFKDLSFKIMPDLNPSIFLVQIESKGPSNILVTSLDGKVIYNDEFKGQSISIDLTSFASGIYFVSLVTEGQILTQKIINL